MEQNKEMIEKANAARSAEELQGIAGQFGLELNEEQAKICFDRLHGSSGELSDEELENVSGGGCQTDFYAFIYRLLMAFKI